MGNVKCIRLDTGEVLMGFVKKLWNGDYEIRDAQRLVEEVKDGRMEVNFGPFIPYAKEYTFVINKTSYKRCLNQSPNSKLILRLRQATTESEENNK